MKNKKPHVAIFLGGEVGSHDLSLETGQWLCYFLPRSKYRVTPVRVTPQGKWQVPLGSLPEVGPVKKIMDNLFKAVRAVAPVKGLERLLRTPVDALMTVIRGRGGDDGALQGLGASLGISVVGSPQYACQQTSDKYICGQRLDDIVSAPVARRYRRTETFDDVVSEAREVFMPPLFVKPVQQEGGWGVIEVLSHDELAPAVRATREYGDILIQQRAPGTELTLTLFDDARGVIHQLPPTIVVPQRAATFYDHLARRRTGRVILHTPRRERLPILDELEELTRDVYNELGCKGAVSFDVMVDEEAAELLDVNTVPTLTSLSPLMRQLKMAGVHPSVFFDKLVRRSLDEGVSNQ